MGIARAVDNGHGHCEAFLLQLARRLDTLMMLEMVKLWHRCAAVSMGNAGDSQRGRVARVRDSRF